ncbi:hypothetical protein DESA109040_14555 [Deinococcus saxicola]
MKESTRTWLRRWMPVMMFVIFGLLMLAQVWLSMNPV